ncbi:MAG: hypothetical protein KDA60_08215 [Planctomycetales bacterium]|nr:hypothetical protein [Planctomycetales bacterium]
MRLTLRTMLAYLDDILEPNDARELGQKIEESQFASGLVHRIRGSIGKLRLSAPKVLGRGMGADANTVAEYLDNTLPADRVPELEKVCLESDMHLAEVASCHQILTLVLGEPAKVEPDLRQRVYELGVVDGGQVRVDAPVVAAEVADRTGGDRTGGDRTGGDRSVRPATKLEIPEHLRPEPRRVAPLVVVLLLAFVFTAGTLWGLDRFFGISRWIQGSDTIVAQGDGSTADNPLPEPPPAAASLNLNGEPLDEPLANDISEVQPGGVYAESGVDVPDAALPDELAPEAVTDDGLAAGDPRTGDVTAPEVPVGPADVLVPEVERRGGYREDAGSDVERAMIPEAIPELPTDLTPDDLATDALRPSDAEPGELVDPAVNLDGAADAAQPRVGDLAASERAVPREDVPGTGRTPADAPVATPVGRLSSPNQVLAYWDELNGHWFRVPDRAPISVGQRIRVMPTFRPNLMLAPSAIQMALVDGSDLAVEPPSLPQVPAFRSRAARVVLTPFQEMGGSVTFRVDDQDITVSINDPQSTVAIEVDSFVSLGQDPTADERIPVTRIWVLTGRVRVEAAGQPARVINQGQQLVYVADRVGVMQDGGGLPDWADGSQSRDLDRGAATDLLPLLSETRPLALSLAENAEHRRVDLRSLVARSLARIGRFDVLVSSFADVSDYSAWRANFEEVTAACRREPESARLVQEAFQRVYEGDGAALFRMCWGYDDGQLSDGGAAGLVDQLEHESLEFRVLSFENLRQITGSGHLYDPKLSQSRRKRAVLEWRDELENNRIVYKRQPEGLPAATE